MSAAGLLLLAQALAPAAATDLFMRACVAGFGDSAALRTAAAAAGFVEETAGGPDKRLRRGAAWIDHRSGAECRLVTDIAGEEGAERVIADVSAALDLGAPRAIAMHPPGWTRWRWPIAEGAQPRHYLAATTIRESDRPVNLDLSIFAGPRQ